MFKALSKKRSSNELLSFHMKFVLLVIIGALLWNNNDARYITADILQDASEFVRPTNTDIRISFWTMTQTTDNIVMRDELQDAYINEIIDGMDLKDLIRIVYDNLEQNLEKYTVDELIEEVEEYYPHLLENN